MEFPNGTTPFEIAESQRVIGQRTLTTGYATHKLVELLRECNTAIEIYRDAAALYHSDPTELNREEMETTLVIATEALKEKRSAEAALEEVATLAETLGFTE